MRIHLLASLAFSLALFGSDASRSPLITAARAGDRAAIRALIQKKVDVNGADPDGSTALLWAAYRNDLEAADLLLAAGANPNAATDLGVTPLWTASENGGAPLVRRLLAAGANPNLAMTSGETPLMIAARSGHADAAQELLAKGANPNAHGTRGQTALMWAISQKHPEVTKVLLAHKADIKLKSDVWNEMMAVPPHGHLPYNKLIPHGGETALMFAARVGDLDSLKQLVAAGANVNDADAWGVSALVLAMHSGFNDSVQFLLDKGANPNDATAGFSALQEAIMRRDEAMVTALLNKGADVNFTLKTWTPTRRSSEDWNFEPPLIGATPFWIAARLAEPEIMKILVAHGADPKFIHHVDYFAEEGFGRKERKENITALMAAVNMGGGRSIRSWVEVPALEREANALAAVQLALDWGVDINAASTDGRTALDGARAARYESIVKYLTGKGAKGSAPATTPQRPTR